MQQVAFQWKEKTTIIRLGLNFGDSLAYALAKVTGKPLFFKGNDFSKTDIAPAR